MKHQGEHFDILPHSFRFQLKLRNDIRYRLLDIAKRAEHHKRDHFLCISHIFRIKLSEVFRVCIYDTRVISCRQRRFGGYASYTVLHRFSLGRRHYDTIVNFHVQLSRRGLIDDCLTHILRECSFHDFRRRIQFQQFFVKSADSRFHAFYLIAFLQMIV